jgi:hypothetical protein
MRGDMFLGQSPVEQNDEPVTPSTQEVTVQGGSNLEENTKAANKPGSIIWWAVLFAAYLAWDYAQGRTKISESIQPRNMRANVHNLIVVGAASVIFINGANVLFTKLAAMKIPVVSRVAGTFLPLFHL